MFGFTCSLYVLSLNIEFTFLVGTVCFLEVFLDIMSYVLTFSRVSIVGFYVFAFTTFTTYKLHLQHVYDYLLTSKYSYFTARLQLFSVGAKSRQLFDLMPPDRTSGTHPA